MGHEELGSLLCQGMAVNMKHPGLICLGLILPFAKKKLHTRLVIEISTWRKQIHVAQGSYWDNS